MASGNVTATTADTYFDESWSAELNRAIKLDIVIAAKFEDKSSELPHGNLYHIPSRHHLTANTKSASTDLTPEVVTEPDQTFAPSTHQAVSQYIEDFAKVQSKYDIRAEFNAEFGYSLGRAMDVACGNLFDDNTVQIVGALGAELSDSDLIDARTYLRNSGGRGSQCMFVPPATYGGFLKIDKFTNQLYNGDQSGRALHQAQVGKLYEATVYESQLLPGTSPAANGHWFIEGHFFKIVQKAPSIWAWHSPLGLGWILSADQIYGVFELQEADEAAAVTTNARLYGVRLKCKK